MKKDFSLFFAVLITLLAVGLTACTIPVPLPDKSTPIITEIPAPVQNTYSDPFSYCAAIGTIDTPDARYTGPKISDEIINGFIAAAGLEASTEPMEIFKQTTIWRCMDSQVVVCNYGANLPCSSKANIDKTLSPEMQDYCKANPDSDFIPMSVTGHETIYSWHCIKDAPEVLEQIAQVDAAGYLANIWYRIAPGASPRPVLSATSTSIPILIPNPTGGSNQILFASNRGGAYDDLYLLDLTSSQVARLTQGDSNTFPGPFSPDGSQILFTDYGLTHSYVGVMSANGDNPVGLTQAETDEGFATWSPDGTYIAFTSRRDGNNEIYVMNADGSGQKRLTNNPADDFAPAWSPDGSRIAFVSDRTNPAGVNNLYVMNTDGSNIQRLTNGSEIDYSPAWSPDGAWIAFRAHHDGASADIYLVRPDGTGMVNLTNNPAEDWAPVWSPDGALLAFQTNRDGNWEIYIMNAGGSNPLNQTQNLADDQMPYWSPSTGLANPASENCVRLGGRLVIEERGEIGEFGVCYFEDNRQCEEWALFRGECPVGGVKVTGYMTEAARFCAITGGEYAITANSGTENEQGICMFSNGYTCDVYEYYDGKCSPNSTSEPILEPSAVPSPEPVASPTSTVPALTFTPAATFTPSIPTIIARMDTNCRSGPNLLYPRVGYLLVGQQSTVHGRNTSNTWWYIANLNRAGEKCWVWADTTTVSGNIAGLPVITPPPLPKVTDFTLSFSNLHVCGGVTYMIFRVKNIGNDTFWSSSITIRDITHDQGFSGPEKSNTPFIPSAGACPPGVKQLPGGETAYVAKGIGTSLPSGTKMRGIIVLCTEPSLGGTCVEHKVNFVFP